MARPLSNRSLLRRASPLLQPHTVTSAPARRFHATVANLTSTIPDPPPPFATALRAKSIYFDSFPCTLHYYSSRGPKLALHASEEYDGENDPRYLHQDRVFVDNNGLVNPGSRPHWSGAMMYPNTLLMLENMRSLSGWAHECQMRGQAVARPWIFTIPKVLNEELNDFFNTYGSQMPEEEWASKYFMEGYGTYMEHEWMSR